MQVRTLIQPESVKLELDLSGFPGTKNTNKAAHSSSHAERSASSRLKFRLHLQSLIGISLRGTMSYRNIGPTHVLSFLKASHNSITEHDFTAAITLLKRTFCTRVTYLEMGQNPFEAFVFANKRGNFLQKRNER